AMIASAPDENAVVRSRSVPMGTGTCTELSPDDATIDLPLDAGRCHSGQGEAKFTTVIDPQTKKETVGTALDSTGLAEGIWYRRVVAYDAAGNAADLINVNGSVWEAFEVWHPVLG